MSMSNDPTHPKITENTDDVEGHGKIRRVDAEPEAEGLDKISGPQERSTEDDDVEGHRRNFVRHGDDEDVEGHGRRP